MTKARSTDEPLRGEAAFKEAKRLVSERNDAASARCRSERAERDAAAQARRRAIEREEARKLAKHPTR